MLLVFFNAMSRPPGGSRSVTFFCFTTSGSQKMPVRVSASASSGTRSSRRDVSTELIGTAKAVKNLAH
jgi:hypothetical protein